MIIRKAEIKDILKLSDLATRTFYQAYDWYNTPENMRNYVLNYFSKKNLEAEISDPETAYYLAEENEELVGYFKLGRQNNQALLNQNSHSEIERIYVDEKLQRGGIGKQMLDKIISLAKERKNEYIWLGVWQKNEKAIAFYKKNGFEILGITTFVLGDDPQDDFVMGMRI